MAQGQVQINKQQQEQKLTNSVSQLQLLQAKLSELPLTQLVDYIRTELDDNPALEIVLPDDHVDNHEDNYDNHDIDTDSESDNAEDFETEREREERQSQLNDALNSLAQDDDELPVYTSQNQSNGMTYEQGETFYDSLTMQMMETELSEKERQIMEYIIGSLDSDGWLRKSTIAIADELTVFNDIDVNQREIDVVLKKLQDFDPAGIGARSLKECLMLQIKRRDESLLKEQMTKVVEEYFNDFTKNNWKKIKTALKLNDDDTARLRHEMVRLNPKPGTMTGGWADNDARQVTPDVYIDTHDDGSVTFALNNGDMPNLTITPSFLDIVRQNQGNSGNMSRQMREALIYAHNKVGLAQRLIDAIKIRRNTLTLVVKAIIHWQHDYFVDGDDSSIRPMKLKDIAEKTNLDISTVSRACNGKYAQTNWGILPFRHFFCESYVAENGEELSKNNIKKILQEIIDKEDKNKPLSDDSIANILADKGFPIARRTVAKYREQLGIPVAKMRR